MGNEKVKIFDTTLRDGEQAPSYAMSIEGKERVARQLALLNVDVIEAGFPVSSPAQYEAAQRISDWAAEHAGAPVVAALARTTKNDIEQAASALESAIEAGKGRIHIFIATSPIHMRHKLRKTPEEVLDIAAEMTRYARRFTPDVEFSLEDATRTKPKFMHKVITAALQSGAKTINIPDTVGNTVPEVFYGRIRAVYNEHPEFGNGDAVISVHCHNDFGLAVANSIAAVRAGARQVECSVNGIGERAGNASLEEVVMVLKHNYSMYRVDTGIRTRQIYSASRTVVEETGIEIQPNKAIVGRNAFSHQSGIHQHGMLAHKSTYEAINPEDVGRKTELVLGRHSGKHAVIARLEQIGIKCDTDKFMQLYRSYADRHKEVTDAGLRQIAAEMSEVPAVK
jgi:2-isopropylmalate synthase